MIDSEVTELSVFVRDILFNRDTVPSLYIASTETPIILQPMRAAATVKPVPELLNMVCWGNRCDVRFDKLLPSSCSMW